MGCANQFITEISGSNGVLLISFSALSLAGVKVQLIYASFCESSKRSQQIKEKATGWVAWADLVPRSVKDGIGEKVSQASSHELH